MTNNMKSPNLTSVSNFRSVNDCVSQSSHWIVFTDLHPHCQDCVRPFKCMQRLPRYSANIPEKDVLDVLLDIEYHRSTLNSVPSTQNSVSPTQNNASASILPVPPPNSVQSSPSHLPSDSNDSEAEVNKVIDKCPVIKCPNGDCQFIFHYCKLREHFLVCQFEKIKCINCDYGCPFVLLRGNLSSHLRHCPAMVVHCSMEWNRWPLHTTEKKPNTRVHCPSQALDINNLDVALALRDQRMLKQLWSASRQMKRIMRGRLSVHPAVPIKPYIGIRTHREYGTNFAHVLRNGPRNGAANRLGDRVANGHAEDGNDEFGEENDEFASDVLVVHHDEEKYIRFAQNLIDSAYKESLLEILRLTAESYVRKCTQMQARSQFQRAKAHSICPSSKTELECFEKLNIQLSSSSSSINLPVLSDLFRDIANANSNTDNVNGENKANEDLPAEEVDSFGKLSILQPPLPPPVPKCNALSLELSIWAYPFFNPKPRPMYTFRCGSNFRSDEIHSHSKDIHSSIHGGLDGWIEYRCPLFQYGCPFVIRRWEPISGFGSKNQLADMTHGQCQIPAENSTSGEVLTNDSNASQSSSMHSTLSSSFSSQKFQDYSSPSYSPLNSSKSRSFPRQTLIYNETLEAFACPQVDEDDSGSFCADSVKDFDGKLCYESSVRSHNRSVSVTSNYNSDGFANFQERLMNRRRSSNVGLSNSFNNSAFLNGRIESPSAKTTYSSASIFSSSRLSCPQSPVWDSLPEVNLLDLPFELLQHICSYLDPFTLNSLSFTSHMLRSVVKTFLKHKGYVVLQWKRYEIEKGQYRWSVANKKWIFSTAIAPITGWRMNSTSSMHSHLQNCPYYNRTEHRRPSEQRLLDLSDVIKSDT